MVLGGAEPLLDDGKHPSKHKRFSIDFNWYQVVKFINSCKVYACFDCVVINHQKGGDSNEHGTIHVISSDFGDRMTMQSIGLMVF